jgi:hypothetical protein
MSTEVARGHRCGREQWFRSTCHERHRRRQPLSVSRPQESPFAPIGYGKPIRSTCRQERSEILHPSPGPDGADPAVRPGLPEKATHDYLRHGTTSLFAALEIATGKVTDVCNLRHTSVEFLRFPKIIAKSHPRVQSVRARRAVPTAGFGDCR